MLLHSFPYSALDGACLLAMFGCAWFIPFDLFSSAQGGWGQEGLGAEIPGLLRIPGCSLRVQT